MTIIIKYINNHLIC